MSDPPPGGRGTTAPLPRHATQVSPSAVPSTLESPKDADGVGPPAGGVAQTIDMTPGAIDEISGPAALAPDTEPRRGGAQISQRAGPPTLLSPLVLEKAPPADPHAPALPAPPVVTIAPPPAHAYVHPPGEPRFGGRSHAGQGNAHGSKKFFTGTVIAVIAAGVLLLVLGIGVSILWYSLYETPGVRQPGQRSAPGAAPRPPSLPNAPFPRPTR